MQLNRDSEIQTVQRSSSTVKALGIIGQELLPDVVRKIVPVFEIACGSFGAVGVGVIRRKHKQVFAKIV